MIWIFILLGLKTQAAQADQLPARQIQSFLQAVNLNTLELKKLRLDGKASRLKKEITLQQFDWSGYLNADLTDSDNPPTSPFSSDSSKIYKYETGVSKLWSYGFETSLAYSLTDNLTTFPSAADSDFFKPDLSFSLKTNLFRELFNRNLQLEEPKILKQQEVISLETKIKVKSVLVSSLLLLADILELSDETRLQKALCDKTTSQTRKLAQKRARQSISEREYLISKKDQNTCQATIKSLEKQIFEKQQELQVQYGVDKNQIEKIAIESIFSEIHDLYEKSQSEATSIDPENIDDLLKLKSNLEALKLEQKQLYASSRANTNLELKAGFSGLNKDLSAAHDNVTDFDFPYIIASLEVEFPFANREAKINRAVNGFAIESGELELELEKKSKVSRFHTLKETLARDYEIYRDYKENVYLSEQVLSEAQRDFNNGRIDFFSLSEFQKSLIQSRRQLAGLRSQIVVRTIEYIDYFHFFDTYF